MYNRKNLNELLQQASILTRNDLADKTVLLRSCLNLTINSEGQISDITRLTEAYPTIELLALRCKKLIVMAHIGRPISFDKNLSLEPVYRIIEPKLTAKGVSSQFVNTIDEIKNSDSKVCVLENIRFNKGEESVDEVEKQLLIDKLSDGVDFYVNDAFPDYRESVSTYFITNKLKSFLGPCFLNEVKSLSNLNNPIRPYVAVIGGAKLSEKIDIVLELVKNTDKVLIGGAMAYTFMKAQGIDIGNSLHEPDKLDIAKEILSKYSSKILLPLDHKICDQFTETSSYSAIYTSNNVVPVGKVAIDIGHLTQTAYINEINAAKTILINGPMGVYEWNSSLEGTKVVYEAVLANKNAFRVLGGGDSIASANKLRLSGFDHISTGGGAMLLFLSKSKFPTLDIILDQYES